MPTFQHEVPLHMIRQRPHLAVDIVREVCGITVPDHDQVLSASENVSTLHPAELTCDGAVLARKDGKAVFGVVSESQLRSDDEKNYTWPAYVATFRHQHKCEVALLVFCRDEAGAARFRTPIMLGPPGSVVYPIPVCPRDLPPVTDPDEARRLPELAIYTAPAHADTAQGVKVIRAYCEALETIDRQNGKLYHDYAKPLFSAAAYKLLEEIVKVEDYQWQSDFAIEHQSIGRAEGRTEGRTEGEVGEAVKVLLLVLQARGVRVSAEARERINDCGDLEQLERWIERAATIDRLDELFR